MPLLTGDQAVCVTDMMSTERGEYIGLRYSMQRD